MERLHGQHLINVVCKAIGVDPEPVKQVVVLATPFTVPTVVIDGRETFLVGDRQLKFDLALCRALNVEPTSARRLRIVANKNDVVIAEAELFPGDALIGDEIVEMLAHAEQSEVE